MGNASSLRLDDGRLVEASPLSMGGAELGVNPGQRSPGGPNLPELFAGRILIC